MAPAMAAGAARAPRDDDAQSPSGTPFWSWSLEQTLARVASSAAGLTSDDAASRLARFGPNELAPARRFQALRELVQYVANPLVLILLVASGVSAAFGQIASAVVVALMLVLSVALNFTQAYRSQRAAEHLRQQVGQTASVLRDGTVHEIPVRVVVPGDIVQLRAGDLVPADAALLSTHELFVNEAALTGESLPSEKHAASSGGPGVPLVGATNAVFRGSSVVSGLGVGVVVRTGAATEFGAIATALGDRSPETEFERGTRQFGYLILR